IYTVKNLAKKFKKNSGVKITLIDKNSYMTYMTELYEVAADRVDADAIQYDLQKLFCHRKNVNIVTDEVRNIDRKNKQVITKNGSYPYDYLVLSAGSEPNSFSTPGVEKYGYTLGSLEQAIKLKHAIEEHIRLGAVETDSSKRKSLLTLAVVGSGFTGIEMIGELIDWKKILAKENKIDPSEIKLTLIEMAPTLMNMLDRKDADKGEKYLIKHGVEILKNTSVVSIGDDSIDFKDGSKFSTSTLIWTAGIKAPDQVNKFGLQQGRGGRILVNKQGQSLDDEKIYVLGDVSLTDEDGSGKGQPQTVQGAEAGSKVAAKNIALAISGQKTTAEFEGKYSGFVVSIGSKYAVAHLGKNTHLSGFFAQAVKHMINFMYFFQITNAYYFLRYLRHEFFNTRNERNMFHGYISRQGNVLWSLPARLFLGATWLVDVSQKISGKGSWFANKLRLTSFDWLVTNTTSGASAAGSDATSSTATTAKATFSLSYEYGNQPMLIFNHMPKWYYNITKFMIPNTDVAFFMQKAMTIFELLIGLALVFGLFTWLASAASVAFVAIFSLSSMFYWTNIWMIPMAIAAMNGSGRIFGLDKYIIPWIRKHFVNWWYGKEKAIYK
ncbi:NAD(P)/FAD-dependent oxidoreductase, partial [Oenococcus oeni]|uniref:NAD(P)/FAD-dependent oxidoreductase n=1 Tax=Oenococcus oeni TaxID=1247 RepID=UPI000AF2A2FF